jgi:hypothetical protein
MTPSDAAGDPANAVSRRTLHGHEIAYRAAGRRALRRVRFSLVCTAALRDAGTRLAAMLGPWGIRFSPAAEEMWRP